MSEAFALHVTSLEGDIFQGEAESLVAQTDAGDVGILANHIPLVATLKPGVLTIKTQGEEQLLYVSGGLLQVADNQVRVLADHVERSDEIDQQLAEQALAQAQKLLAGKPDTVDHHKTQLELIEALAKLRVVELARKHR